MKFAWHSNVIDFVAWNSGQVEGVDLEEYTDMLDADDHQAQHELDSDEESFEYCLEGSID